MDRCEDRRKSPLWCGVRISGLIETLDRLTPAVIMTRPPVQRFAKAIVESMDFSALGTQDRLVLIGFDPRIAGGDTDRGFDYESHPPCLPKGGLGLGILALARTTSQSSGESHVMNELFLSRSAWLIESHWSSCRLPGKTNSSASRSGNHDARSESPDQSPCSVTLAPAGRRAVNAPLLAALVFKSAGGGS